mmetsp:Transcript_29737/g.67251  ORF Transcript_29737/g.67251 Transcript_29737/m.67251 type:complete len:275 (+) Transcript_29737:1227-2051(+)
MKLEDVSEGVDELLEVADPDPLKETQGRDAVVIIFGVDEVCRVQRSGEVREQMIRISSARFRLNELEGGEEDFNELPVLREDPVVDEILSGVNELPQLLGMQPSLHHGSSGVGKLVGLVLVDFVAVEVCKGLVDFGHTGGSVPEALVRAVAPHQLDPDPLVPQPEVLCPDVVVPARTKQRSEVAEVAEPVSRLPEAQEALRVQVYVLLHTRTILRGGEEQLQQLCLRQAVPGQCKQHHRVPHQLLPVLVLQLVQDMIDQTLERPRQHGRFLQRR